MSQQESDAEEAAGTSGSASDDTQDAAQIKTQVTLPAETMQELREIYDMAINDTEVLRMAAQNDLIRHRHRHRERQRE